MNLLSSLVSNALKNKPNLSNLKMVVEKEILHHDILSILSKEHLLKELTFIGGTCLRLCYGGVRLSEDLDFTGGNDFSAKTLTQLGEVLTDSLYKKYSLKIIVSEPTKEDNNVKTWKIKIETNPGSKHIPSQRINIDICTVSSYEKRPAMLINHYGIDLGTRGLIIQSQSREEIFTDKLLAFALRNNRIKYRDLWDMIWLNQLGIKPNLKLLPNKLNDRGLPFEDFSNLFAKRITTLTSDKHLQLEFNKEMQRFLPKKDLSELVAQEGFWEFTVSFMQDFSKIILQ